MNKIICKLTWFRPTIWNHMLDCPHVSNNVLIQLWLKLFTINKSNLLNKSLRQDIYNNFLFNIYWKRKKVFKVKLKVGKPKSEKLTSIRKYPKNNQIYWGIKWINLLTQCKTKNRAFKHYPSSVQRQRRHVCAWLYPKQHIHVNLCKIKQIWHNFLFYSRLYW